MIKLSFAMGSSLRRAAIDGRIVSLASHETGFKPIKLDLDKLKKDKRFSKLNKEEKKLLEDCRKLNTEEEMAKDLIKDFQRSGWRLIKKDVID